MSVYVFTVLAAAILLVGCYLWWKTRELRRQLRARAPKGAGYRRESGPRQSPPINPIETPSSVPLLGRSECRWMAQQ